ncbi:MAG: CARDB domain-containing protein [Candidatus Altiarchaeia archaeon]
MAKISNYFGLVFVFLSVLSLNAAALVPVASAQVTSLSQVPSTSEGNSVYLWAQVKNTGNVNLDGYCFVRFYVMGPATNKYVGYRVCTVNDYGSNIGVLVPGEQRWYRITWTPPQAGDYKYYAMVENYGAQISPWSTGQSFKVTPKVTSAQVTSLSQVANTYQGTPVVLWAQVKNTGSVNLADNCFVRIYVTGPGIDNYVRYKACTVNGQGGLASPLKPGELRWYQVTWTAPQAGDYTYKAYVEYLKAPISAWSGGQVFKVLARTSTASITQTKTITAAFVGKKVSMGAEVANTGNADMGANCFVRFWVKGPGIDNYVSYKACDVIDGIASASLKPGAKRWYSSDWTPSQPGQYQYKAVVEYQKKEISKWSTPRSFFANPLTTTTTTRKTSTTTSTRAATTTTLFSGIKWDVSASFKIAKWKAYTPQIWGADAVDGATYYAKFSESDDTYTTYNRYCPFDGRNGEYPDSWHIERKYISPSKYMVLVRGRSTPDCDVGQPQNKGFVKLNPESGWKITSVGKCTVSEDTKNSNGVFITTWCMADAVSGVVTWQSGSTCIGCCVCGEGALVDIEFTVEK